MGIEDTVDGERHGERAFDEIRERYRKKTERFGKRAFVTVVAGLSLSALGCVGFSSYWRNSPEYSAEPVTRVHEIEDSIQTLQRRRKWLQTIEDGEIQIPYQSPQVKQYLEAGDHRKNIQAFDSAVAVLEADLMKEKEGEVYRAYTKSEFWRKTIAGGWIMATCAGLLWGIYYQGKKIKQYKREEQKEVVALDLFL